MRFFSNIRKKLTGNVEETCEDLRKRGVRVGEDVAIYSSYIDGGYGFLIDIGDRVTITNATILAHDASTKRSLGYTKVGRVRIGNDVFIGYGSIILSGVTIGNNVIIGAGSIVREDIPDNCVVAGNPAQVICHTDTYLEKNRAKLQTMPKYDTYWKVKSQSEKEQMREDLKTTMGFNV